MPAAPAALNTNSRRFMSTSYHTRKSHFFDKTPASREVLDSEQGNTMPTLYVENVPDNLYEALRARAQANRTSISAEVLGLLAQNVPTPEELSRRKAVVERAKRLRSRRSPGKGPFPSAEEMLREDRGR